MRLMYGEELEQWCESSAIIHAADVLLRLSDRMYSSGVAVLERDEEIESEGRGRTLGAVCGTGCLSSLSCDMANDDR